MAAETGGGEDPYKVRLTPAFSVLVGGHRGQRLERNWLSHGDTEARRASLQATLERVLRRLYGAAAERFASTDAVYADVSPVMRLITGRATGTNELARSAAARLDVDLHLMSTSPETAGEPGAHARRGVVLGAEPVHGAEDPPESVHRLRDDLALTFSDMLVAVWDGQEPHEVTSGAGQMIRDAVMRRQGVLLLYLDPEQDTPQLMMLTAARVTDAALTRLDVMEVTPAALLSLFDPVELDSRRIDEWLERILCPFTPALDETTTENRLIRRIDDQVGVGHYVVWWGLWLLGLAGLTRRRRRPPGLWNWVTGSWMWLHAMLEPPARSQPSRVVELLQTDARDEVRRHWVVNRLHAASSALAMLDLRGALRALRPAPSRGNRYNAVRPSPEREAEHPIREPAFEHFFNWSDEQAGIFATRHQDDTWMIYYAAAMAVFAAVAGALQVWPAAPGEVPYFWIAVEFVLLHFIVRRVLKARYRDHHGHWIRFRFLAEQLRYLRLGYPLLVLPKTFSAPYWRPENRRPEGRPMERHSELESAELWVLQRLLVAEGMPQDRRGRVPYRMSEHNEAALDYIHDVLDEHREYYRRSAHNLEMNHKYLHRLAFTLFFATFLVVTLHFFFHFPWSLFFTAFFPAWGAAIHGILAQNEVVRMSAMSGQVWRQLRTLEEAFALHKQVQADYAVEQTRWMRTEELRELVGAATHILSDANRYWRSLLRHNQADLPG
ncbi:hypothetical protein [Thioalkalivibrio sp. ALgr3]|uniref:hypothetical protein n=1 Tax=Thioalkalivibrio sp. ALgr3 TaxID=1239292 RepID=UPI00036BF3B2|nr:hypothetical protein [Thioalkalivibrio sp. ALgr3]